LPIKNRLNLLFGKGDQYISWIHLNDLVKIIFSIATGDLKPEVYNCVSPNPVTQKNLNDALKILSNIKAIQLRLSKKLLSLIMGEMSELFLNDLNVSPENLLKQNFQYTYPDINTSIKYLLKNSNF
jgi:NAD dependent epimerase/dehydratase family enzyme